MSELKEFLTENEEWVQCQLVQRIHKRFDKNMDQVLDFEEFLEMINDPNIKKTFKRIASRYLRFVAESSIKKNTLTLRRTLTNTGRYEEQYTFSLWTIGMITISILQIILFYADFKHHFRNEIQFEHDKSYEIWRYFSYILAHDDEWHLYGNVVLQLGLGIPLELVHSWRVPLIYVNGAAGSCLFTSVISKGSYIGASGGVYSFYSAHIATVIMNWNEMSHPLVPLIIFTVVICFDTILNYFWRPNSMTSYEIHLGGTVMGLLLGIIVLRNLRSNRKERILWRTAVIVLFILIGSFIIAEICMDLRKVEDE